MRLRVEGADSVALDGRLLRITTAVGELTLPLPAADSSFRVEATTTGGSLLSFDAAPGGVVGQQAFDIAREAPADNPAELLVSTFLGGSSTDAGNAIALDSSGRVYVTGETGSSNFPTTPGAFGGTFGGGTCGVTPYTYPCGDAFVVRLNAAGSALDYATFLGGSNSDFGEDLTVDSSGRAIVTGRTSSGNFPTTAGAYDRTFGGGTCGVTPNTYPCDDAFVVRLNAAGSVLDYATFLGGGNIDAGSAIALDRSGRVTVTGETMSGNFPTTSNAYDRTFGGGTCGWAPDTFPCYDAFVVRLNAAASALDYATFLGGSNWDSGYGLALDSSGRATVTGETRSNNFPTTPGAFDRTFGGGLCGLAPNTFPCNDAFVVRLNVAGSSLDYATFLGGSNIDSGAAIVLDDSGRTTVTGITWSSNFPTTSGAFDRSFNGDLDTYVARLNAAGSALDYATFLGGYASDRASALALDGNGRVTVTGSTQSSDFPTTTGAFDRSHNGGYDSYVARLNPTGSSLDYATFLGGTSSDTGGDLAMDTSGRAVVTGITFSSDFPTTPGAFDPSYNGGPFDAFVAKLAMGVAPPPTQTPTPTATATPTQTPTSTPLPTSTPVGPWAAWHSQEVPLLVPPNGVDAVVDYGNLTPPILLDARVSGAALFDTGAISGTTWISTTLWTVNGSYALPLIPAISATQGDTLTLDVAIGPVVLTQEGRISRPIYLPLLLR